MTLVFVARLFCVPQDVRKQREVHLGSTLVHKGKRHKRWVPQSPNQQNPTYPVKLLTCFDTGIYDITNPQVYASKTQKNDPDTPTFHQAIHGELSEEYIKDMQIEIATLILHCTWECIPRTTDLNVLKGTWVFKLKASLTESLIASKHSFVHKETLRKWIDFFETYAPFVL